MLSMGPLISTSGLIAMGSRSAVALSVTGHQLLLPIVDEDTRPGVPYSSKIMKYETFLLVSAGPR